MKKLTNKQIKKIKELFNKGEKVRAIAKIFKVNPSTISYWINDERRKQRLRKNYESFKSKSLEERRKIYKKRLPYLRDYQKKRYNSDEKFREKKKSYVKNYYQRKWKNKIN